MQVEQLKSSVFSTSIVSGARVLLALPIYLILTPWTFNALGAELFGIWSFSTIILGLMSLTDFGFKNGLVYFVAKHRSSDSEELIHHFSNTFFSFVLLSLLIVLGTFVFAETAALSILNVPKEFGTEVAFVLIVTALSFALRFIATSYQAVIEGDQKVYITQLFNVYWLLANFGLTVLVLLCWPNVYALTLVNLVSNVLFYVLLRNYAVRHYAWCKPSFVSFSAKHLKQLWRYSFGIQIATFCIVLREPILKTIVANEYGLEAVAMFDIAYRFCTQVISLAASPLLGVFAASALIQQDEQKLKDVLLPYYRYPVLVLMFITAGILQFSDSFFRLWMGIESVEFWVLLNLIFAAFTIYYCSEALYKTLEGRGFTVYSALLQAGVLVAVLLSFYAMSGLTYHWSLGLAIFIGFALFTVSNCVAFFRHFPQLLIFHMTPLCLLCSNFVIFVVSALLLNKPAAGFVIFTLIYAYLIRRYKLCDTGLKDLMVKLKAGVSNVAKNR